MAVFEKSRYTWYEYTYSQPFLLTRHGGNIKLHRGMKFGIRDATSASAVKDAVRRVIINGHPSSHVFSVFSENAIKLLGRSTRTRKPR